MMPGITRKRAERRNKQRPKSHVVAHAEKPNERKLPRYWADDDAQVTLVANGQLGERDVNEIWELLNLGPKGALVFRKQDDKTVIQEGQTVRLTSGIKNLPEVEVVVARRRLLAWRGQPVGLNLRFTPQLNMSEATRVAYFAWTKGKVPVGMREKRL